MGFDECSIPLKGLALRRIQVSFGFAAGKDSCEAKEADTYLDPA